MRIISGKYKGKKLFLPKDKNTRPLKDLVKVSIFNMLDHSKKINKKLEDSSILDLFSGSGSFGIECLSRGSKIVYFFENYFEAIKILEKNLSLLKNEKNFKIFKNDCFEFFNSYQKINEKFDIIFLDPPYKIKNISELLNKIRIFKLLDKNGIIILHRHKDEEENFPINFKIVENKKYGISKIMFISH